MDLSLENPRDRNPLKIISHKNFAPHDYISYYRRTKKKNTKELR